MDPDEPEYTTLTTVVEEGVLVKIETVDFDGLDVVQLTHDLLDGTTVVNQRIVNSNDIIISEDGSATTVQEYFENKSPQKGEELVSDDGDYLPVVQIRGESPEGGAERSNDDKPLFGGRPSCGSPKLHFCPKCGNSFNAAGSLKSHIRTCLKKLEKQTEEQRTCGICDKVFHSVAYLKEHMKRHATGVEIRRCAQCYRRFTDEAKWKAHLETHKKQKKLNAEADALTLEYGKKKVVKEFTCSFCSIKFKVAFDKGQQKRRFTCDECRTKYSDAEQLKQRKEMMSVQREFYCDRCGRKFVFEGSLQRHLPNCYGTFKRRRDMNDMD